MINDERKINCETGEEDTYQEFLPDKSKEGVTDKTEQDATDEIKEEMTDEIKEEPRKNENESYERDEETGNEKEDDTIALFKSAIFRFEEELLDLYTLPDEDNNPVSEEDLLMAQHNVEHVKALITKFFQPAINNLVQDTSSLKKKTHELAKMRSNSQSIEQKRRTSWSIFLSEIAKTLPGWKEAHVKVTFASSEYEKLSQIEKKQLVVNYYKSHNIPLPNGTNGNLRQPRLSGLDAFRKHWYEERKKNDPASKGLDSKKCITDWNSLTDIQKAEWKEIRRQQLGTFMVNKA